MTLLKDQIDIRIQLHHDHPAITSSVYSGQTDLLVALPFYLSRLSETISRVRSGTALFVGGAIEIHWNRIGLHEVPEVTGGDN